MNILIIMNSNQNLPEFLVEIRKNKDHKITRINNLLQIDFESLNMKYKQFDIVISHFPAKRTTPFVIQYDTAGDQIDALRKHQKYAVMIIWTGVSKDYYLIPAYRGAYSEIYRNEFSDAGESTLKETVESLSDFLVLPEEERGRRINSFTELAVNHHTKFADIVMENAGKDFDVIDFYMKYSEEFYLRKNEIFHECRDTM